VARNVSVTGTLAAEDEVLLGTKVVGRLSQITVDLGSRVRRGQAIARIDPGDYRLRVEQAEATLQQARARLGLPPDGTSDRIDPANTGAVRQAAAVLKEARLTRDRMVELWERQLIAHAELNTATSDLTVAEGRYQDAVEEVRNRQAVLAQRRSELRALRRRGRGAPRRRLGAGDQRMRGRGPDLESLAAYAEQLRVRSKDLGIVDADTTLKLDRPELRVVIDRKRAADLNVDTEHIATAFRLMVGGDTEVSRFHDPTVNEEYDVQLRLSRRDRDNIATISRLYVPRAGAGLVRLDNLVEFESVESASRIDRLNRQRQVSLRAQIAPGFALADRLEALNQAVRVMNLPAGYTTSVSGRGRELARTFNEFL
jgi:multidrug efflux pump subunit AcrA (membrane-fusion protein)